MGHELRTPLNAVLGFSQLLAKDELSERQSTAVEQIMDAGQNMLKLVEQVLNFSKVGVESKTVETSAINSQNGIISALDLVDTMAQRRCISLIDLTKNNDVVFIVANEAYFIEILLSFITNAISYIPENGTAKISSFKVEGDKIYGKRQWPWH